MYACKQPLMLMHKNMKCKYTHARFLCKDSQIWNMANGDLHPTTTTKHAYIHIIKIKILSKLSMR